MSILTLNFIVDDKEQFIVDNKTALDTLKKIADCNFYIQENTGVKYKDYLLLLMKTDSKYTMLCDEHNVINISAIKHLIKKLSQCEEKIIALGILGESLDRYQTKEFSRAFLYFNRYVFKTDLLKAIEIKEQEYPYFEEKVILNTIKNREEIPFYKDIVVETSVATERSVNSYAKQFDYDWYIPFLRDFILPYMQEHQLSEQEQRLILYFIVLRFYLNYGARDKQVIQDEEVDVFFQFVKETVLGIEDQYIIELKDRGMMPAFFSHLLLKMKHGEIPFQIESMGRTVDYKFKGIDFGDNCVNARVDAINWEDNQLIVDGELVGDYCLPDIEGHFGIYYNDKLISYEKTERYNIAKAFGKSIYRCYPFRFKLDLKDIKHNSKIQFKILVKKSWIQIPIQFKKISSRLIRSRWPYYKFADYMISYRKDNLIIKRATKLAMITSELGMCTKIMRAEKKKTYAAKVVGLRMLYWMTKKHCSAKKIWIFYDKLYKAGDNAEYLFRYCMEHFPDVECYYILNKNAHEYKQLKKQYGKHIVVFESLRNRLVVLHADIIFATHATVFGFCGFGKKLRNRMKDLLTAEVVCIQHGLTIQNIAQYQNRLADNTKKYFCASKYEIANLKQPIYGYDEKNLYLTGCPRYDGLVNNDQKQILIAPTWRRNIVITGNKMGTAKSYNPDFKRTKYFEIYNSLINDERVLSTAQKYGYKLVFLIHPTLSSQVEDYDTNEYLSIIPAVSSVSYEKMLTESSLMLTDYSGIQFDFAYMKKPILYYQPKELPPQYTEGVYQYDTMGFGPIIDDYEAIIESLCEYMKQGCEMQEEYIRRVDDFFAYTDHSNCKRIMDVILG